MEHASYFHMIDKHRYFVFRFSCDEPRINVRIGDKLNFVCPSDELTFYVPSTSVTLVHENLYLVGTDRIKYDQCNATGICFNG